MKIAVLFHRLGPYHFARLRALARVCELHAVEYSAVDVTYDWDAINDRVSFRRTTLFVDSDVSTKHNKTIEQALQAAFASIPPDVVAIPGWAGRHVLAALDLCHRLAVPTIVMSASTEYDYPRVWWREWLKTKIIRCFSAALVGGVPHKAYMQKLGMPAERIFVGYDVVDNAYFADGSSHARENGLALRKQYCLPENYFLASSRFIAKKNLFGLIEAYAQYRERVGPGAWKLVLLGDGVLRPQIEHGIAEQNLSGEVLLPGFKQYQDLPVYYGLSKAFIQASTTEQWGLVVNEAMACGVPVLVSNRCGCAPDLVSDGLNGFQFDPYNVEMLSSRMVELHCGLHDLERMGKANRETMTKWTPELFAANMVLAAKAATEKPGARSISTAMLLKLLKYL